MHIFFFKITLFQKACMANVCQNVVLQSFSKAYISIILQKFLQQTYIFIANIFQKLFHCKDNFCQQYALMFFKYLYCQCFSKDYTANVIFQSLYCIILYLKIIFCNYFPYSLHFQKACFPKVLVNSIH